MKEETIKTDLKTQKSQAKEIDILLKVYKKWYGRYHELASFKEPVLLLMRRSGTIEFKERATRGLLEIMHTDGTKRYINLDPKKQMSMPYGGKEVRAYICHEDFPFPLPTEPLIDSNMFTNNMDLTLNNAGNWRAKEIKAQSEIVKWVVYGVIGVILALIFWKLMIPDKPEAAIQAAKTGATIARNITIIG